MITDIALNVLKLEAQAILDQIDSINDDFIRAIDILKNTEGRVVITGMGKSGIICKKISATMASTGTPSFFVHPAEAIHGDLGMIVPGDSVIAVSNSGETEEIVRLVEFIKRIGVPVISITSRKDSALGRFSDIILELKLEKEACPLNLAPTSSTTATLALGDAIAMVLLELKEFRPEDFAARHPGGGLGKKLLTVDDLMHKGHDVPVVSLNTVMKDVIYIMSQKRLGMTAVVDSKNTLCGIISDGDLRRHLEEDGGDLLEVTAEHCMTKNPKIVKKTILAAEALNIMETNKITSLIVADDGLSVEGVIHLHDLWKTKLF